MSIAPHDIMLRYTADFYEKKITTMENYAAKLSAHLSILDNLQGQLRNQDFWTGDEAAKYYQNLTDQITHVRRAQDTVMNSKQLYEESKAEIEKGRNAMNIDLGDIAGLMGGLDK